jgi:hypothetical protein
VEEDEPEPILPPAAPAEDHRREVPPPWVRARFLGSFGDVDLLEQLLPSLFVVLLPLLLAAAALAVWAWAALKRQMRGQGVTEADLAAGRRSVLRVYLTFGIPGLVLVLAAAGAWLALDTERRPDEHYLWTGWYLVGSCAWLMASSSLLLLAVGLSLARNGVGRLWRRWAR